MSRQRRNRIAGEDVSWKFLFGGWGGIHSTHGARGSKSPVAVTQVHFGFGEAGRESEQDSCEELHFDFCCISMIFIGIGIEFIEDEMKRYRVI